MSPKPLQAQIVNFDSENSYNRVFVDTDNFGISYLDILESSYPFSKIDTIRFNILNDLAYYWHTRNLIKALNFTKEGLQLTRDKKDTLWEGRFQITEGAILLRMEKLDSARFALESAMKKVLEKDLPLVYTQLGYVYERQGKLDKAADIAMETLILADQLKDKRAMAVAFSDLSNLFWKQSRYEKALEYGQKALTLFEERGLNDLDYDFTLYVVGNCYLALDKHEEALNYYEHSIAIGERYGFYNNLCDVYISMVYLKAYLNDFDAADLAGENAVKYGQLLDNNFMLMRSWLSIGKSQNLQGKYISAIESLERSIDIATADFGDDFYLSQAYEALGKAYAGNHNYREAYQAYAEYDKLKKEIFTAEADQHISLLLTEFDVAQKESTIIVQENQIKKQRSTQTLMILIGGLLLLILILLYNTIQTNKKKNILLKKQNDEKEFLLKEIHHRVKNNLEVVSSLLSLQSEQVGDTKVADAMHKSQLRVHSMSMVHQKLYQGQSFSSIEMKEYFKSLGDYIVDIYGASERIHIECEMKELELDVDTAIPIGLIVNELFTNALKYAFPDNRKGFIKISLIESGNQLHLEVSDNGIGKNFYDKMEGTGFGTQLIELLTRQLEGKMSLSVKKGTAVSFEFQNHKAA
ncbi:histidine kinase dimerization/phosphoacceptor domain -containing protein [uncultured Eudoraea sp.]|uniref:sensor histidine kinase n=1 Tax=uncultured Eudoraea sp. TaxID=1035614 RepID=UPI00260853A9|nr:histidine kinase dimerization/phosphoacceptor domain -containing protein [uncultured Eudoraea sp.]